MRRGEKMIGNFHTCISKWVSGQVRMRERRLSALTLNFGKGNTEGFSLDYRPLLAKDGEDIFVGRCQGIGR